MANHIFISHTSKDDKFVKALREGLEKQGLTAWVDSRELTAGEELVPEIGRAIDEARAFILVLSRDAINSPWVLEETKRAIKTKKKRNDGFPVIPVMLEGIEPPVLNLYFPKEPLGIKVKVGPGGISEAMPDILAGLGKRLPDDALQMVRPDSKPVEELVLRLTDPRMYEKGGVRRAQANAKLIYSPSGDGARKVESKGRFVFTAPIGPIEAGELQWYLERYAMWPTGTFNERADEVEKQLPIWGKSLYEEAFEAKSASEVLTAWQAAKADSTRRFTIFVDSSLVEGAEKEAQADALEAATGILTLPWELLHDGRSFLFHGRHPVQVRRRLPNTVQMDKVVTEPPIRILLISPRPEDKHALYIDHRASALPLVSALETLGELTELTVLSPPTFQAFEKELTRADKAGTPYHVIHFDGHGVFSRQVGLGSLCFESPDDGDKLEDRSSELVDAKRIGDIVREHRIPLVFLEACQTAAADDDPTASVAASLLDQGVASVVAMSHSVLVETARRFVEAFYTEVAKGERIGEAMIAGQRKLKSDDFRFKIFGAGDLRLQDWFVPVLYQEEDDPQLLTYLPSRAAQEIDKKAFESKLGKLPEPPEHGFVGRSRELLKLERLLEQEKYGVACGVGGEGKTALAVELTRWLVRSNRFDRSVFVSVENIYDVRAIIHQIGDQLVNDYVLPEDSAVDWMKEALKPIERELRNHRMLFLFDNIESILPRGNRDRESELSELARFEPEELERFLELCGKLLEHDKARVLFTSREIMPKPFDGKRQHISLSRLYKNDAVELVKHAMTQAGLSPKEGDKGETQPEIEALVEAVNCHARSLVLLAPYVSDFGVENTTENVSKIMAKLHERHPDEREQSLYASVELSLHRLSPEIREKIKPLGVFQGGGSLITIAMVLGLDEEAIQQVAFELVQTGLAQPLPYGFLRFDPALCPYQRSVLGEADYGEIESRWAGAMLQLSEFLYNQLFKDAQLALNLATFELPNLMQLVEHVHAQGEPEATVGLATSLEQLLSALGRKHLLRRVAAIRQSEEGKLGGWGIVRFNSWRAKVERLLESGTLPQALKEAEALLRKCLDEGDDAYEGADYDTALAHVLSGRVLQQSGAGETALVKIEEAQERFQKLADEGDVDAEEMATACLAEKGDCLRDLGRLDKAAEAYQKGIKKSEDLGAIRTVAVGKGQLGTLRMLQGEYNEAIKAHEEAREIFDDLGEPAMVAVAWHQIGMVYEEADRYDEAEKAYKESLAIKVRQKDRRGEASTLVQLGNLYDTIARFEDAVSFYRKAADKYADVNDMASAGVVCNNLARTLLALECFDEARSEIERAIECKKPYGHSATLWHAYSILCDIETAVGNHEAAREARQKSIDLYLDYRKAGGENRSPTPNFSAACLQAVEQGTEDQALGQFRALASDPETPDYVKNLIPKLQQILDGSRDPSLADDPELDYDDAAELLLLLEQLEQLESGS